MSLYVRKTVWERVYDQWQFWVITQKHTDGISHFPVFLKAQDVNAIDLSDPFSNICDITTPNPYGDTSYANTKGLFIL